MNFSHREDEHQLIAQYCQSLNGGVGDSAVPRSPVQVMAAIDQEQREELEAMIRFVILYLFIICSYFIYQPVNLFDF